MPRVVRALVFGDVEGGDDDGDDVVDDDDGIYVADYVFDAMVFLMMMMLM